MLSCCCCFSVTKLCPTFCPHSWPHELQHTRLPYPHYLPEFARTHIQWVNDAIQPSHPLLPPYLPALNLSQHQGVFQWNSSSFPSGGQSTGASASAFIGANEYSGLISFRIEWCDMLAVQGTLRSLLQHHNLKASVLWHSAFLLA